MQHKPKSNEELFRTVARGDAAQLRSFLEHGLDPNTLVATTGQTLLMCTAHYGHVEVAAELLNSGADVNHPGAYGTSALCSAAHNGSDDALLIMEKMLTAGAKIEGCGAVTPLMCASCESYSAMELLLRWGANPNAHHPNVGTPLHIAARAAYAPGIKLLMSRGADPRMAQIVDQTPPAITAIEYAKQLELNAIASLLENGATVIPENIEQRIFDFVDQLQNTPGCDLRPGASAETLSRYAAACENSAPALMLRLYERADGQDQWASESFLSESVAQFYPTSRPGFVFLSIDAALALLDELDAALDTGCFDDQRNLKSDPGVARCWWSRHWIPFLSDQAGTYVCIDTGPAEGGDSGQVILFEHDSPVRRLLARSVEEFFATQDLNAL